MQRARPNAARWMPRALTALTVLSPEHRQGLTMRDRILFRSILGLWLGRLYLCPDCRAWPIRK